MTDFSEIKEAYRRMVCLLYIAMHPVECPVDISSGFEAVACRETGALLKSYKIRSTKKNTKADRGDKRAVSERADIPFVPEKE